MPAPHTMVRDQLGGEFELVILPGTDSETPEKNKLLEAAFYEIHVMLGGTSVKTNLAENDYKVGFNRAMAVFRAQSERSIYMSYGFLQTLPMVQSYVLHEAIDHVDQIYRKRALFGSGASGTFDYFSQIAAGLIYPGSQPGGYMGIATYDFALQYEELLNREFARDMSFRFRPETHTIYIEQVPKGEETLILRCSVKKTITELMKDNWARNWLILYTCAFLKTIMARKRGKFATIPGAQGGIQLDASSLAQEGTKEMEDLEQKIRDFIDGGTPAWPILA